MYHHGGGGLSKDDTEALVWLRKSAAQSNSHAQNDLGAFYMDGVGVEKNSAEAVKWFRQAAEGNNPVAQYNMGYLVEHGQAGLAKDDTEALQWYRNPPNRITQLQRIGLA